jgi:hypothetical protein
MNSILIGLCAVLTCGFAVTQNPSEFAKTDAKLQACMCRDSSNMHIMACNSVVQIFAGDRLNDVYQALTEVLKHPNPDEAKDNAEILRCLVAAEGTP